jgi:hypothetical protein
VYDPISQAPKIRIPVLVFSTDGALIPEQAKKFYERVKSSWFWAQATTSISMMFSLK